MDGGSIPPSSTTHGGQIFSVPLFLSRNALFLRAFAFCLVDAIGHISLVFVLREHISLFFFLLACGRVHELSLVFMRVFAIGLDLAAACG